MHFRTIVLPIDLASETPPLVATRAFARHFHARVVALYVKRAEESTSNALADLGRIVEHELEGVATRCLVRDGQPGWQIVEMAARMQADAIALFPRAESSSVSAKVLLEARSAVWALSAQAASRPFPEDFAIRSIVCGVDFTRDDRVVISAADEMAREVGATLTLAYAVPHDGDGSVSAARDELLQIQRTLGVQAETFADIGGLNRAATATGADLLIVARADHRFVREAVVPVLALPT